MKNKMDVKNMLERNLGIIDNSIKLDSEGLREILYIKLMYSCILTLFFCI